MRFSYKKLVPFDIEELQNDLISARLDKEPREIIFYGLILAILVILTISVPSIVFLNNPFLLIGVASSIPIGILCFILPRYYIKLLKDSRKRKINIDLGSAITFMYALSSGHMNLPEIFRRLAKHEKAFGEMAQEAKFIVTEIDYFSSDLESAINELVKTTPSEKLQDFLIDLIPVMRAGGNITTYLFDKTEQYLSEAIDEQENFIEFLGYLSEIYISAFVAGPLMIILGLVIMILSFGQAPTILYYIIYLLLPLGGVFFIILIKSISPINTLENEEIKPSKGFGITSEDVKKDFKGNKVKKTFFERIKNFYVFLLSNPANTLIITAPISIVFFIERIKRLGFTGLREEVEFYSIILMLLIFGPITILYEIKRIRNEKLKKEFPDLLRVLEGLNKTGMTLKKTFLEVSDVGGLVGKKLELVKRGLKWDFNLENLLKRFSNNLNEKEITRSIIIILEGTRAHGNISSVLLVTKNDSVKRKELFMRRKRDILPYIVLVWVAFLIFIGTAYIFRTSFLGSVPTSGLATGEFGFSLGQVELISEIITHASMIMGFFSGLIAGELSEGDSLAGLKHSIPMVIIAYLIFLVLI